MISYGFSCSDTVCVENTLKLHCPGFYWRFGQCCDFLLRIMLINSRDFLLPFQSNDGRRTGRKKICPAGSPPRPPPPHSLLPSPFFALARRSLVQVSTCHSPELSNPLVATHSFSFLADVLHRHPVLHRCPQEAWQQR